MQIGTATKNRLLTWFAVMAFGGLAGQAYVALTHDTIPAEVLETWPGLRGGILIAGPTSAFEIFVMRGRGGEWLRHQAFLAALSIRILVHTVIIVCSLLVNRLISALLIGHFVTRAFAFGEILQDAVYSFFVVALSLFVLQMRALIGGRTLFNVVLGRYHHPVRERRIFVLADLAGSTALAEKIGDERFHEFLSAFFFEIDAAVIDCDGEVYSYVGDAIIVSWPLRDRRHNARAVEALFLARRRLQLREQWFSDDFHEVPRFRAVLHGGSIVAGECGDSRRQITYLGEALNTTARLEALSKQLGAENLISGHLLDQLVLPHGVSARDLGQHRFKGAAEPLTVYELIEAQGGVGRP